MHFRPLPQYIIQLQKFKTARAGFFRRGRRILGGNPLLMTTETRTEIFDAQVLGPDDEAAVVHLSGGGLPWTCDLPALLRAGAVLGDYAGTDSLQAAAALLPMYGQSRLALSLRAAGCGADGQGTVLTPLCRADSYLPVRRFLRMAMNWASQRCANYHIWAALPYTEGEPCEELCAQYLAAGLTLRSLIPVDAGQMLVFAAHSFSPRGQPARRLHLHDPALPRYLERGYLASDFGWDREGMLLTLRPGV